MYGAFLLLYRNYNCYLALTQGDNMNKSFNQLAQIERDLKATRLRLGRAAMQLMSKTHPDMHSELKEALGNKGSALFMTGYSTYLGSAPVVAIAQGKTEQVKTLMGNVIYGNYI